MDEDLLNQAESETARDKRLVRQAESEMRGDKAFLENAYRSHKGWKGRGGRGGGNGGAGAGVLSAQDENALRDIDCPAMRCEEAQAGGFLPTVCSTPGDCPRIRCWDYQEQGACKQGRICSKPSRRTASCTPTRAEDASWTSAKCPGMHCSHAKRWGYTPVFCTIAEGEGDCPTMSCFDYADEGGCEGNGHQGFRRGRVCKKPRTADSMCATKWAAREAGGGGSGVTALSKTRGVGGEDYRGVSPLHNMHSSKAAWSRPKMVESRMAILIFLVRVSLHSLSLALTPPPHPSLLFVSCVCVFAIVCVCVCVCVCFDVCVRAGLFLSPLSLGLCFCRSAPVSTCACAVSVVQSTWMGFPCTSGVHGLQCHYPSSCVCLCVSLCVYLPHPLLIDYPRRLHVCSFQLRR